MTADNLLVQLNHIHFLKRQSIRKQTIQNDSRQPTIDFESGAQLFGTIDTFRRVVARSDALRVSKPADGIAFHGINA
jgi:hypothetical protein